MLNWVIGRTPDGYELEADLRHAELIVEQLELHSGSPVVSPGIVVDAKCTAWDGDFEPEEDELPAEECTRFCGSAARCNSLQPDRLDIQFAVKEVCRLMSRPAARAWLLLKRIGRYLNGRPRLVWRYCWQAPISVIDVT